MWEIKRKIEEQRVLSFAAFRMRFLIKYFLKRQWLSIYIAFALFLVAGLNILYVSLCLSPLALYPQKPPSSLPAAP